MIMLTVAVLVALFVSLWTWVRSFFQDKVIQTVRESLGEVWAEYIVDAIMFLDRPISMIRAQAGRIYQGFKTHVLGIRQRLSLIKPGKYNEVIETDIYDPTTRKVTVVTRGPVPVGLSELPEPLRQALVERNVKEGVLSWGEALDQRVQERAREENIPLTLEQANA